MGHFGFWPKTYGGRGRKKAPMSLQSCLGFLLSLLAVFRSTPTDMKPSALVSPKPQTSVVAAKPRLTVRTHEPGIILHSPDQSYVYVWKGVVTHYGTPC